MRSGDTLAKGQGEPLLAARHQPETGRRTPKVLLNPWYIRRLVSGWRLATTCGSRKRITASQSPNGPSATASGVARGVMHLGQPCTNPWYTCRTPCYTSVHRGKHRQSVRTSVGQPEPTPTETNSVHPWYTNDGVHRSYSLVPLAKTGRYCRLAVPIRTELTRGVPARCLEINDILDRSGHNVRKRGLILMYFTVLGGMHTCRTDLHQLHRSYRFTPAAPFVQLCQNGVVPPGLEACTTPYRRGTLCCTCSTPTECCPSVQLRAWREGTQCRSERE